MTFEEKIADYDLALVEASNLATSIWAKYYQEDSPHFGLCDSLSGILSQLDNMTTGLTKDINGNN